MCVTPTNPHDPVVHTATGRGPGLIRPIGQPTGPTAGAPGSPVDRRAARRAEGTVGSYGGGRRGTYRAAPHRFGEWADPVRVAGVQLSVGRTGLVGGRQ